MQIAVKRDVAYSKMFAASHIDTAAPTEGLAYTNIGLVGIFGSVGIVWKGMNEWTIWDAAGGINSRLFKLNEICHLPHVDL